MNRERFFSRKRDSREKEIVSIKIYVRLLLPILHTDKIDEQQFTCCENL